MPSALVEPLDKTVKQTVKGQIEEASIDQIETDHSYVDILTDLD